MDTKPFVFISYSHSDAEFASTLSDRLRKAGISHFIDQHSIAWGEHIPEQVHNALEKATHLLVLISPGSEKSSWVAYEMGYARGRRVTVVPYLLHPRMDVPGFIANIKYLCGLKEEAEFIARIRKHQAPKVAKPLVPTTVPAQAPVAKPSPKEQLMSASGTERRAAVIAMGEEARQDHVATIEDLLKSEKNQNVRESAIKALGRIGGERAITLLEEIWFGQEPARFGKDAAKNALQELNVWSGDGPFVNPATAQTHFISLHTRKQEQDGKRNRNEKELLDEILGRKQADLFRAGLNATTTAKSIALENFNLSWTVSRLQQQWYYRINYKAEARDLRQADGLIHWSPSSADGITFLIKYPVEIPKIANRATRLDLKVESLLADHIEISGEKWPCLPSGKMYSKQLRVAIATVPGGTAVDLSRLPWGLDVTWVGCLRLSLRLAKFLQG